MDCRVRTAPTRPARMNASHGLGVGTERHNGTVLAAMPDNGATCIEGHVTSQPYR